jgi:hypothetical protein
MDWTYWKNGQAPTVLACCAETAHRAGVQGILLISPSIFPMFRWVIESSGRIAQNRTVRIANTALSAIRQNVCSIPNP